MSSLDVTIDEVSRLDVGLVENVVCIYAISSRFYESCVSFVNFSGGGA
jgi:hypothetical protein